MKFNDGAYGWFNCKTQIALFFVLSFFGGLIKAQSPLVFKSYTVSEGLSHNFARKTIQDSEGFIWIATIDGLNRFDGYTFKTYKTKPNDSTSLSSDNIIALAEDKHGNLWIGPGEEAFVFITESWTISNVFRWLKESKILRALSLNS